MKSIKNLVFILIILLVSTSSCVDTEIDDQMAQPVKQKPTAEVLSQDENFQLLIDQFQALSKLKKNLKVLKKVSGKASLTKEEEQELVQGLGFSSRLAFNEFNKNLVELGEVLNQNYDFQDFSQVEIRELIGQSASLYKPVVILKSGCIDDYNAAMAAAYTEYYTDLILCGFLAGGAGVVSGGLAGGIVGALCWAGAELGFDGAETSANAQLARCQQQQ